MLKAYQDAHGDNLVIQGADTLGRTHTERLVNSGYLQMVMKGWYIPSSPGSEGDSTVWYVSYWHFITAYLDKRFNGAWCLSPELSLYFHSGKTVIPKQLIVRCENGTNNILQLPFGTSLVDIKASLPPTMIREPRYGVRLYPMEYALLMVGPDYYRRDALEARTCLASLRDVSPIVLAAIDGGHTTRAGRVAGALRSIGREEMADELLRMMRQVGYTVTEENPFEENVHIATFAESPYASRIRLMWMQMRNVVIDTLKIQPVQQDAASVLNMRYRVGKRGGEGPLLNMRKQLIWSSISFFIQCLHHPFRTEQFSVFIGRFRNAICINKEAVSRTEHELVLAERYSLQGSKRR